MFDLQVNSRVFKKVGLLLLILMGSVSFVYGDTSSLPIQISSTPEENKFGRFLKQNLYLTAIDYHGNLGIADLFMIGERHHGWLQTGFYAPYLLGAGVGYRYLFTGDHPYQDWFVGLYGYIGGTHHEAPMREKVVTEGKENEEETHKETTTLKHLYNKLLYGNIGLELGTAHYQFTVNGYDSKPWGEQQIPYYDQDGRGWSIRVSTYYWQKMGIFGRANPFVFGASTKVMTIKKESLLKSPWVKNVGFGIRWELSYLTLELKAMWDEIKPAQFLRLNYQIGCQVNLAGHRDRTASYAKHRVREMHQGYRSDYYHDRSNAPQLVSRPDALGSSGDTASTMSEEGELLSTPTNSTPHAPASEAVEGATQATLLQDWVEKKAKASDTKDNIWSKIPVPAQDTSNLNPSKKRT
jgi:hypothetical protein